MTSKKFQRTVEDFTCAQCGAAVKGDGYTNHCPHCLTSKHVDIHPGDRANPCGGLMIPVALEQKGETWIVTHRCRSCGTEMKCKTRTEDFDAVLKLAKRLADPR